MSVLAPRFRVVLPDPGRNVHARAFDEISIALAAGLRRLGVELELTRECRQGDARVLVLAPHLQSLDDLSGLDRDAILYTWEQLAWSDVSVMSAELMQVMSEFVVWDYSPRNLPLWMEAGAARVLTVPLGYEPLLACMPGPVAEPDVDVLFYGSLNERRRRVLAGLQERGLQVKWLFGAFGAERDSWIRRSRLVLNMHFHSGQILEVPRLAYLWVNRVPVVSELNPQTDDPLRMGDVMVGAPYDELVDTVEWALRNPGKILDATAQCAEKFSQSPSMAHNLRYAFASEGALRA